MNWHRVSTKSSGASLLDTEDSNPAENRLKAIRKAVKSLYKGVEESLRTSSKNKNDDLEVRKKRSQEYQLGHQLASAAHALSDNVKTSDPISPLHTVIERYANFEKTIGHMLAANELEITNFLSKSPLLKLLEEEIPAVNAAKKDLDTLKRKQMAAKNAFDRETKRLEKMFLEEQIDQEMLRQQEEKTRRLLHEKETINKDVDFDQDKLCSKLLSLVSRENRYANSVLELLKIKQQFYVNAFTTITAELPNLEGILRETQMRPIFGEDLDDHLRACKRKIAKPIALSIKSLREGGLTDEGLFRIPTKQIKLDKVKAFMDYNMPLQHVLQDCDAHFYAALLKCYLRELPIPLLGRREDYVYDRWTAVPLLRSKDSRIREIRYILKEDLPERVVVNIQYLVKFLAELTKESALNKMTPKNLGIVLGPSLLFKSTGGGIAETGNIDSIIKVVAFLIEYYNEIFPIDINLDNVEYDDGIASILEEVRLVDNCDSDSGFNVPAVRGNTRTSRLSTLGMNNSFKTVRTIFSKMTPVFEDHVTPQPAMGQVDSVDPGSNVLTTKANTRASRLSTLGTLEDHETVQPDYGTETKVLY